VLEVQAKSVSDEELACGCKWERAVVAGCRRQAVLDVRRYFPARGELVERSAAPG